MSGVSLSEMAGPGLLCSRLAYYRINSAGMTSSIPLSIFPLPLSVDQSSFSSVKPAFEYLRTLPSVLICPRLLRSASSALPQDKNHFRGLPLQAPPWHTLVHVSKRLWVRVPQVELNFLISTCYLSSTSFYLSSTPFCVPVFIQLCLAWNRERDALHRYYSRGTRACHFAQAAVPPLCYN